MTYLYTESHALTLPACLQCGQGIHPGTRFAWAGLNQVRVSLGEETFTLPLRPASEQDRQLAVNRDGWCYVRPLKT